MATFIPFKALRYNPEKIADLSKVMAPPYDILSPKDQDFYYNQHSNNIVKLDFGKSMAGDNEHKNKYSRAATLLKLWSEQEIIKKDPKPGYYVVGQNFVTPEGQKKFFLGVVGLLKLEPYKNKVVLPHERTLSKPKSDRLDLTRATQANLSQIFMLFEDQKKLGKKWLEAQAKKKPVLDIKTTDGVRHRLWPVFEGRSIKTLETLLKKLPFYIADGHHRYETMLNFSQECSKKKGALGTASKYTMVCVAPMQSPGLTVLPTHRQVFGLRNFNAQTLLSRLGQHFDPSPQPSLDALLQAMAKASSAKSAGHAFGLVLKTAQPYTLLKLKAGLKPASLIAEKRSEAYKNLDVALLQSLILEAILGMTPESIAAQENLHYTKSARAAADSVLDASHQAAFLLNPTKIEQVRDVSLASDTMPQKSTYFLPKLLTGLVLRKIE